MGNRRKLAQWQRNLYALCIGNFITGAGASMSLPFLSLFISEMGHYPKWELTLFSSTAYSITFLTQAIFSPMWGKLADRTGRKPMLLRAAIGMTITATLTGLSPNVWILIGMRLLQGAFSGYINNAYALVAGEVPREQSGKTMGTLTTGSVGGQLIGPIIGGAIASVFGYRVPFYMFGGLMFIAALVTYFGVKENFEPIPKSEMQAKGSVFEGIQHVRIVWAMIISSMLIQAATTSINPIISLYVKELMHNHGNIAVASGIIAALPGIATLIAAPKLGSLGDKIGPQKVLLAGLVLCGLFFLPMFFAQTVLFLGVFRFLVGISDAALLPVTQTVMTLNTPKESISRIFSYNQSFQAIGSVVGPLIASGVAGIFDYRYVFLMTTLLVVVNLIIVRWSYKKDESEAVTV
jgi:DHA1 family multidrug resistance protein-like MFS transporter